MKKKRFFEVMVVLTAAMGVLFLLEYGDIISLPAFYRETVGLLIRGAIFTGLVISFFLKPEE